MSRLRIGDLKHRIQLQSYKEVEAGAFNTNKTWTTIATVYAQIKPVSGYTTFDTQQINKGITHKITIRYYPYITSENWVMMEGRRFRIRNVTNPDESNVWMVLLCEEVFLAQDPFEVEIDSVEEALIEPMPSEDA